MIYQKRIKQLVPGFSMKPFMAALLMVTPLLLAQQSQAQFFNQRLSVQGFLKSAGVALNDNFGYFMQFKIKRNSTVVWCQSSAAKVPVINGVFNSVLSGASNCSSLSNTLSSAVFSHSADTDAFTIDVVVDMSANGFGGADDATFAGIDMVASPMALLAKSAEFANAISGTIAVANGGTGATTAAGARTNLGLGSAALVNLNGNSSQVMFGDGSFAAIPTAPVSSVAGKTGAVAISSADISDATNLNTASMIVKRDASGNFSAGTITATLSGNATNVTGTVAVANGGTGATTASAARSNLGLGNIATINTSGSASQVLLGDGTFGSVPPQTVTMVGDVSGTALANTVDKIKGRNISATAPTGNQVLTWNSGTSVWEPQTPTAAPVTSVAGRTGAVTISSGDITDATELNTASKVVRRDASGNFSAGTITATLSGNATNVTGTVAVANGGTGATTAAAARTSLGAAASGANTDITSMTGAVRQSNMSMAVTTGGATNAYTLAYTPTIGAALASGMVINFLVNATNAANATLNVDGLGAKPLFSQYTAAAVAASDLPTATLLTAYYNGTNWYVDIPPRIYSASALSCGASITANSSANCTVITATGVNVGDAVTCSPNADPGATNVVWSSYIGTAGQIQIRMSCVSGTACTMTARNWRCVVQK